MAVVIVITSRRYFHIGADRYLIRPIRCAVRRRNLSVGETPTRQLLFQPVATGTHVEATKHVKLAVERVLLGLREHAGRNVQ